MKRIWLAMCFLLGTSAAWGQTTSIGAGPTPFKEAFVLQIEAPDKLLDLLTQHLELQRYRQIDDLSDNELDRLIDSAKTNATELAATLGYFSPTVRIQRDTDKQGTRLVKVLVEPGEPVRIGQVKLQFSGAIDRDQEAAGQRASIVDNWGLPVGKRFTQDDWDSAKQKTLRQLTRQRYPAGQIAYSLAEIDPANHTAALQVTLDSGDLYRWGPIEVTGLQRYDDTLAQRLARIPSGTAYDLDTLVAAQRRLTDSGFFNSVNISLDTNSPPDAATVLMKLQEAKLQKLVLGVGVSTDNGTRMSAEHTHMLLPWLGWQSSSKVSVDQLTQSINAKLMAQPDEDGWRWNTSAELKDDNSGSYQVISQRLKAGSTQKTDNFDRSYFLQYDRADSAITESQSPVNAQALSVNYGIAMRKFDSLPFPSSGWGLSAELGGGYTLGANRAPFTRVLGRWQGIWTLAGTGDNKPTLARSSRLSLHTELGAVVAKKEIDLPATALFLAGGSNSVRGYALNSIGIDLSNGLISPGRYQATGSLEWQRPLIIDGQPSDWETAVFLDAGAVANTAKQLEAKLGLGAGLRWKTPIGPLQIDLAYGVAVKRFRLHLNLGFTF